MEHCPGAAARRRVIREVLLVRVHASKRFVGTAAATMATMATVAVGFGAAGGVLPAGATPPPASFTEYARAEVPPLPQGWPLARTASKSGATTVVPGVLHYSENFVLPHTRERANVLTVNLNRAGLRLGVVAAHDRVISPKDERVTSMARRTGAVAGINGDYFDINADGAPLGGVMVDGALLKSPTPDHQATLTIDSDGTAHIGQVTFTGAITSTRTTATGVIKTVHHVLYSLNSVPDAAKGKITELTSALGPDPLMPDGLTLVTGVPVAGGMMVSAVEPSPAVLPRLTAGQLGLLAGRRNGTWLQSLVPGQVLQLSSSLSDPDAQQMLSGPAVIVQNGAVYSDPTGHPDNGVKNPETMVGISRSGRTLMFAVIDGRAPGMSAGVTITMAAQYLVAHGAWSGILLDGGGSSTMVARTTDRKTHKRALRILNRPSDSTGERPVGDGLFVYTS